MKSRSITESVFMAGMCGCALMAGKAQASTLSAQGGLTLGSGTTPGANKSPSATLGGEYTFGLGSRFELGGFYDQNIINYEDESSGSLRFVGAVTRYHVGETGLFLDGKVGINQRTAGEYTSSPGMALGAGVGYRIPLGEKASISPRAGVRYLGASQARTTESSGGLTQGIPQGSSFTRGPVDLSMMLSIKF